MTYDAWYFAILKVVLSLSFKKNVQSDVAILTLRKLVEVGAPGIVHYQYTIYKMVGTVAP